MTSSRYFTRFSALVTAIALEACKQNYDLSIGRDSDRCDWVAFYKRNGLPNRLVGNVPMPNIDQNLRTVNGKTVFVMS